MNISTRDPGRDRKALIGLGLAVVVFFVVRAALSVDASVPKIVSQEGSADALELRQVVEGRVAAKLDAAIEWVDAAVPDDGVTARLLVVPAYFLCAVALIYPRKIAAVLVDQPDGYGKLKYETAYPLRAFLKRLSGERPGASLA